MFRRRSKPLGKEITEELTDESLAGGCLIDQPVSMVREKLLNRLDYLPVSTYMEFVVLTTILYFTYVV